MGLDPSEELLKINDPVSRNKIIAGLLPSMITGSLSPHTKLLKQLPENSQREVEQAVIKLSATEKVYQADALGIYLGGGGEQGDHEKQIRMLFNDSAWFWKNSDQIGETIENSEPGGRRDIAIENMIKIIQHRDPESARKWLDEIDDQARAQNINSKLFNQ